MVASKIVWRSFSDPPIHGNINEGSSLRTALQSHRKSDFAGSKHLLNLVRGPRIRTVVSNSYPVLER